MEHKATIWRRIAMMIGAMAMVAVACGSNATATATESGAEAADVEASAQDVEPAMPEPESEAESEESTDDAEVVAVSDDEGAEDVLDDEVMAEAEPAQLELGEANWDGLTEWSLPAIGGLRFGIPDGAVVHHDADMVTIRTAFSLDSGRYDPTMVISRVFQTAPGQPVTVEEFIGSAIEGVGSAEPTNTSLSILGEELAGWRFTLNPGLSDGPHYLYSAYPAGGGGPSAWQPLPLAELFIADVPGGVLAVGWTGQDEAAMDEARQLFEIVAPTISLDQSFEATAQPIPPLPLGEPLPPPEPVDVPTDWPPVLDVMSTQVEGGEYSQGGLGTPFSFTLPETWWVQLNFPSWLILSADESFGPGDRGISFRSGVEQLLPSVRSGGAGEGVAFDLRAIASSPPSGIEVGDSGDVNVGRAEGFRAVLSFAESADCAGGAICEYAITSPYPFPPSTMRKGYVYELWYLDGGVNEPVLIFAETPSAEWLPIAQDFVDSVTFDVSS